MTNNNPRWDDDMSIYTQEELKEVPLWERIVHSILIAGCFFFFILIIIKFFEMNGIR